jgi:replicative DNA helicase
LYDAPVYIDDTPSLSVFELRTKARRLVREHGVKILIIDYLQLMNASGMAFGSREQEVSMISRSLKGLAKELNIPIIALSQLNRGVENRQGAEGKRPQLADLRESGAIEQDADMVCFIHRPEYYKITEDERGNSLIGLAEIIVAKHRNGATGDVRLRFKSEFAKFMNVDEDVAIREFSSGMNGDTGIPPIPAAGNDFLSAGVSNEMPF